MKSKTNALSSRKGMTLTEVLVAMTLLVLIIFVFTPAFLSYFKNVRTAGEMTKKTYERASIMERLVANKGGGNDAGYETVVNGVPLKLSAAGKTVDFSTQIKGRLISENLSLADSYATFYTASASNTMVCFPASLNDDFLTKDITVVPKGFKFDDNAFKENNNGQQGTGYHFEVYNTNSAGTKTPVDSKYYDISSEQDGNEGKVAVFTFKGANNVISFENSPLYIQYCDDNGKLYEVKVEISAPEIIMVGEKGSDGNYYYYVTKGVDTETGNMEILAKKMTGDSALKSAMNDVEWVAKGRGDDGEGKANKYGYYVMGGDAGQVRRFWRNETTGNYYWSGDNLINYNRYAYLKTDGTPEDGAYETLTPTFTTQAMFKDIVRLPQEEVKVNGKKFNQLFKSELVSIYDYKGIQSNYFTANVTETEYEKYFLTLSGAAKIRTWNNKYYEYYGAHDDSSEEESMNQIAWLSGGYNKASKLNIEGYKLATDYEYPDDNSLITITSVGAIQINNSNTKRHISQDSSAFKSNVYPTKSYTLYCGYIPAVTDVWGWKTNSATSAKWKRYAHAATLGVAFSSEHDSWVPTGKFGDIHTVSKSLSASEFSNLSYRELLNYCDERTEDKDSRYPYPSSSNKVSYYKPYKDGKTVNGISAKGTALPAQGYDYYVTSGDEVDITIGYFSHPFAISNEDPAHPIIKDLSHSDYYFKKFNNADGNFSNSFFSGGLRDNVTLLDIKSFHDDITGNNISLAVGYTLSYVLNNYSNITRLGQIYNTGIVYIRATGDGTENDTEGDLSSGKGWSLKKETNVFHQFYGIDQYVGNDINGDGTWACNGWSTNYHRNYFNISTKDNRSPQPGYSPNPTPGSSDYGTNCHPLMQTECTTCNWGTTGDGKPQAMWGTSNGTLMSWFYDQENVVNSKITSVLKEFENYTWFKKINSSKGYAHYDYPSEAAGSATGDREGFQNKFGFISTLDRINDVCCADDVWVVAGTQAKDTSVSPVSICGNGGALPNGTNWKPYSENGERASYVNVKYCVDRTNNLYLWKAVKIADSDNVNIIQLSYNQGIWYAMGYIDADRDGKNDADENAVLFWSKNPTEKWNFCKTRTSADSPNYVQNMNEARPTVALTFDESSAEGKFKAIGVSGINSAASQG